MVKIYLLGPRHFRFESAWQLDKSYNNMLGVSWNQQETIINNLQLLQHVFKEWKLNTFDMVIKKKRELMARLGGIQRRIDTSGNMCRFTRLEYKLQNELAEILTQEELMWFQRSKTKWLMDGDHNTQYY
ncbi:hypothetical protein P8452_59883 [Trifolium repens]|jgi:hypothetical protein|nr:hypothetical protein P8452_59883 [Trifolium repens]